MTRSFRRHPFPLGKGPGVRSATILAVVALALVILFQARRADPATGQERADRLAGALDSAHTLEQTFTAGRDDLCAIDVFPRIPPGRLSRRYTLTLRLRESSSVQDLAAARVSLEDARDRQRVSLAFAPQAHSRGKTYRLLVESDAPADTVSLLASAEDAYPGGELRQDGQPTGLDLTFRAYTAVGPALARELVDAAPEYGWLLLFTLLFSAAGWAFFTLLDAWPDPGLFERGLWAAGVGLALVPLVFLAAGRTTGWVLAGMLLLALGRRFFFPRPASNPPPPRSAVDWALPLLYLWALAVRLLQIRDILAPMWTDGLEHARMVQTILDAGRMPAGLLYHIGFHTQVAFLYNLTHLPLPRLIVLFGQMVSALGGPAVYVLAKRVFERGPTPRPRAAFAPGGAPAHSPYGEGVPLRGTDAHRFFSSSPFLLGKGARDEVALGVRSSDKSSSTAALLAALALTAFPSLPAYLINWGRYPFLLGLALLPFTLAASMDALREAPSLRRLPRYALLAALLVGQFLSHYGTLSFWLSFVIVFLLAERPGWVKQIRLRQVIAGGLVLAGAGLAVGYLRFGDPLWGNLAGKLAATIAESRQVSDELDYAGIWQINLRAGGLWLVIVGGCGLVRAALRSRGLPERRSLLLSAGWFLTQAALIAAQSPLLGYALASYANLLLALALPLAILAGGLLDALLPKDLPAAWLGAPKAWLGAPKAWRVGLGLVVALLAVCGGLAQIGIINPAALLYGPADARAMTWIRENLPADARLLINSRFWSAAQIVPADGGGWIPTQTGRDAVYVQEKAQLEHLDHFIDQQQVDYVYLGRFAGLLHRADFEQGRYRRIYHAGGIDIYKVSYP